MKKTFLTFILVLAIGVTGVSGQSQEKAFSLLILSFSKNIQWPWYSSASTFTIGVFSYEPLVHELKASTQHQTIAGRKIVVKEINYADESKGCDVIFIPSFKSKKIPEIKTVIGTSPTLLVTNTFMNNSLGSNINIASKDGKLTYEIYMASLDAMKLKVPIGIKNLGIIIN